MAKNLENLVKYQKSFSRWFLNDGQWEQFFVASKETLSRGDVEFLNDVAIPLLASCLKSCLRKSMLEVKVGINSILEVFRHHMHSRVIVAKKFSSFLCNAPVFLSILKPVGFRLYKLQCSQWGRRQRVAESFNDFWSVPHGVFTLEDLEKSRGWVAGLLSRVVYSVRCWLRYTLVRRPSYLRAEYHRYLFFTRRAWLRQKYLLARQNRRTWFALLHIKLATLNLEEGKSSTLEGLQTESSNAAASILKLLRMWFYDEHFYSQLWGWGAKKIKHVGFSNMNFILFRTWMASPPECVQRKMGMGLPMSRYVVKDKVFNYAVPRFSVCLKKTCTKDLVLLRTVKSCIEFEAGRGKKRWFRRQLYGFVSRHLLDFYDEEALPFLIPENDWFVLFEKRVFSLTKYYFDNDMFLE